MPMGVCPHRHTTHHARVLQSAGAAALQTSWACDQRNKHSSQMVVAEKPLLGAGSLPAKLRTSGRIMHC